MAFTDLIGFTASFKETVSSGMQKIASATQSAVNVVNKGMANVRKGVSSTVTSVDELNRRLDALTKTRNVSVDLKQIRSAQREIEKTQRNIDRLTNTDGGERNAKRSFLGGLGGWGKAALLSGALAAGYGGMRVGADIIKQGAGAEQDIIGLTTFVGKQKAVDIYKQLQAASAATPYVTKSLLTVDRALISSGVDANKAYHDTMNLANAVAAVGGGNDELSRMAMNMQQIKTQGKATAMDVRQFAMTGINIYQLLADATGKPIDKVRDLTVTYDLLAKALDKAGQKGGMYFGAMKAQSQSISGKWSTFMDYIQFGEQNLTLSQQDNIKEFEDILISGAKKIPEIVDAIGPVVTSVFGEVKSMMPYVKNVVSDAFEILKPIGALLVSDDVKKFAESILTVSSDLITSFKPAVELTVTSLKPLGRLLTRFADGIDAIETPAAAQEENRFKSPVWNKFWAETMGRGYPMSGGVNAMLPRIKAVDPMLFNLLHPNNGNLVSVNPYNLQMQLQWERLAANASQHKPDNNKGSGSGDDGTGGKGDIISSGGVRTVTINIGKMVDNFTIHTKNVSEGVENLDEVVAESLLRVLHSSAKMRE